MDSNPYARQVVYALSLALVTVLGARGLQYANEQNGKRIANPVPNFGGIETFLAWGVILVFLIALADMPQTGALGASFAWLILLAIVFVYGVGAAENLQMLMGQSKASGPTGGAAKVRGGK